MSTRNAVWLRKRIEDALALRWKAREGFDMVMCGPDDIETIEMGKASGAEIYATESDYAKYDKIQKSAEYIFEKVSKNLASEFKNIDTEKLATSLGLFWREFHNFKRKLEQINNSKKTIEDLKSLAEKASDLAVSMLELSKGAKDILAMNRVMVSGTDKIGNPLRGSVSIPEWVELKEYGDIFQTQTPEKPGEISFTPNAGLLEEAEVFNFPWVIPYDSDRYESDEGLHDYEWSLGGPWIIRLRALSELAITNAEQLSQITSKGGRKSLGSRIHGSPEDWLAKSCKIFAEANGCKSQAVVLKMVQAVMEAEHGKETMKKMDGKPSRHKGRKAVRKVAQTKQKTRTV